MMTSRNTSGDPFYLELTTNQAEGFNFHQGRTYARILNVTDKNRIIGKEGQI